MPKKNTRNQNPKSDLNGEKRSKDSHYHSKKKGKRGSKKPYDEGNSNGSPVPGAPTPTKQDPFWYAQNADAIKQFASLPFVDVSGSIIPGTARGRNPGIMVVPYVPTMPGSDVEEGSNFASRAADAFYQSIAQGFSANFNFEAPDLLMLEVAAAALYAFIAEGARAYGCMNRYLQDNAYWARYVVEMLGFNFDDLRKNRKEFVSQYNLRCEQINSTIALPKSFFIGERWRYLSAGLFAETQPINYAVVYAYKMARIPTYNATAVSTGTAITWNTPGTSDVDSFFETVDSLIAYLTGSDQKEMFGAIRRVYADSELVKLMPLEGSFVTSIESNDVQAVQLHNSHFFNDRSVIGVYGTTLDKDEFTVDPEFMCYQTADGRIVSNYYGQRSVDGAHNIDSSLAVLSMCGLNTEPGIVLDITADIPAVSNKYLMRDKGSYSGNKIYPRSEILYSPEFGVIDDDGSLGTYEFKQFISNAAGVDSTNFTALCLMSHLNRAPFWYIFEDSAADASPDIVDVLDVYGEIDQYTTVSFDFLRNLHNKCAYQLLALPQSSKSITK